MPSLNITNTFYCSIFEKTDREFNLVLKNTDCFVTSFFYQEHCLNIGQGNTGLLATRFFSFHPQLKNEVPFSLQELLCPLVVFIMKIKSIILNVHSRTLKLAV